MSFASASARSTASRTKPCLADVGTAAGMVRLADADNSDMTTHGAQTSSVKTQCDCMPTPPAPCAIADAGPFKAVFARIGKLARRLAQPDEPGGHDGIGRQSASGTIDGNMIVVEHVDPAPRNGAPQALPRP